MTSIYFEEKGERAGEKGYSKDHRPDLNQMVVEAVWMRRQTHLLRDVAGQHSRCQDLDSRGRSDQEPFHIGRFCAVADRG
jgi:hypothetical protein